MVISPQDWVWFTYDGTTQFGVFNHLNPELQYSLDRLYARVATKPVYSWVNHNEGIKLHAVLPTEGGKYAGKLHFLFNGAEKPNFYVLNLSSGRHWVDGESPKFGPIEALNCNLGYEGKKELFLKYIDWICKFIELPEPPIFPQRKINKYWEKHSEEIKRLLSHIKDKKPEESPMKVKYHLIELKQYDREKKKPLENREFLKIKYRKDYLASRSVELVKSLFTNPNDPWDLTHNILKIGDRDYIVGSGNVTYTDERYRILSREGEREPLLELDMYNPQYLKFYFKTFKMEKGKKKTVTGEEYLHIPRECSKEDVLKYYQVKFPNNNYSFDKKSIPKELSEQSQKLENLPKKGETPAKEMRKICYRAVGGTKVFRGRKDKVQPLLDSGNYEPASKQEWKKQQKGQKSNITISPITRNIDDLGKRKEKREKRDAEKRAKTSVRGYMVRERTQVIKKKNGKKAVRTLKHTEIPRRSKPGDVHRALQSQRDKERYAEEVLKRKEETGKERNSLRKFMSYEAKILTDPTQVFKKGEAKGVMTTVQIKAKSREHAEKIAKIIAKNKGKELKLTGTVRDWMKQTGKNRPKKGK